MQLTTEDCIWCISQLLTWFLVDCMVFISLFFMFLFLYVCTLCTILILIIIHYRPLPRAWRSGGLVTCSRNRGPGPGSKIHYPVPNPGNNWIDTCFCTKYWWNQGNDTVTDIFMMTNLTMLKWTFFCQAMIVVTYYFRWRTYQYVTHLYHKHNIMDILH